MQGVCIMRERKHLWESAARLADLQTEAVPGVPIIEICGRQRVLIEHHLGVTDYGDKNISITIRRGKITVTGTCLSLCRMTKQTVIITGNIRSVHLDGEGR